MCFASPRCRRRFPGPDEVLIRIHATTVNSGDWRVRSLEVPAGFGLLSRLALGIWAPRQPILGTELSGVVASVGRDVTTFKAGDAVFAFPGVRMGCHAEYRCMAQDAAVALKPANLSHAQAAALSFGGTTALHFFRKARLGAGKSVLVNGASGAVGTAAVQLAKHFGAEVTAVCSGRNAAMVTSLGADHVIDYTKEDFTRNGRAYDVIIDTAGTAPFARSRASLRDGGHLLVVLGGLRDLLRMIGTNTMHIVADQIAGAIRIPILHVADPTAAAVREAGATTVGLLATGFTMEKEFYRDALAARGLRVLIPDAADRAEVHRVIYEELVLGKLEESSRETYRRVIADLVARGAEGIILGCTEIGLLIGQADSAVPVFDTAEIHARAAGRVAVGG